MLPDPSPSPNSGPRFDRSATYYMPRDSGNRRARHSRSPGPYLPRRSSQRLNSKQMLQSQPPGPTPEWYVYPHSFSSSSELISCISANSSGSMVKTPVRGRNQSSVAISNSDRTHPEPLSAIQKIQPYYGPALATPPRVTGTQTLYHDQSERSMIQRQYAKIFHVDNDTGTFKSASLIHP